MLLASLEFNDNSCAPSNYRGFCEIAQNLGCDVESISHDGSAKGLLSAYLKAREVVSEATGFFVPNSTSICGFADEDDPTLAGLIRLRVQNGGRLFVQPCIDVNRENPWNGFLAPYDLTVTTLKICKREGNSLDCAPTTKLTIARNPISFRDPALFQGVNEVRLDQPVAIWYGGESLPVLCATNAELPIDAARDLLPIPDRPWAEGGPFPPEWNARELACMAVWYGDKRGAVLASIGPMVFDPEVQDNARLAANIVRWLCGEERPLTPEDRGQRIEVNLADFVFGVIRTIGGNWWTDRIPLPIRQKCAQRHEEEGCRLTKEAYFDLIDLKTVMSREWGLFEGHLRAVGCEGGKEKSLAWMDRLNEIRRLIGHPLKKHVAGYKFSEDDRSFLEYCDGLVRKLVRRVKPVTPVSPN